MCNETKAEEYKRKKSIILELKIMELSVWKELIDNISSQKKDDIKLYKADTVDPNIYFITHNNTILGIEEHNIKEDINHIFGTETDISTFGHRYVLRNVYREEFIVHIVPNHVYNNSDNLIYESKFNNVGV